MKNSRAFWLVGGCVVALAALYAWWAPKGLSRVLPRENNGCFSQMSPKGSYRVDICQPAFPYPLFSKDMPRFVRFYDERSQKILAESDVLEMSGRGKVSWPRADRMTILVGSGDGSPEVSVSTLDGQ